MLACPVPAATHHPARVSLDVSENAQGGKHYKFLDVRAWPYSGVLSFHVELADYDKDMNGDDALGTIQYAMEIGFGRRAKGHVYSSGTYSMGIGCIKLSVGEISIVSRSLSPWTMGLSSEDGTTELKCVYFYDKHLCNTLFVQSSWPLLEGSGSDPLLDSLLDSHHATTLKYTFTVDEGGRLALDVKDGYVVANFHVHKYLATYNFVEEGTSPVHMLLCRLALNKGDDVCYLSAVNTDRNPDLSDAKYLDVEVVVDVATIDRNCAVKDLFQKAHALLETCMTPEQLGCLIMSFDKPKPLCAINQLGKQSNGLFVAGNMAYGGGQMFRLSESSFHILPRYFENLSTPLHRTEFSRHMWIPFDHVRYVTGVKTWLGTMPKMFQ